MANTTSTLIANLAEKVSTTPLKPAQAAKVDVTELEDNTASSDHQVQPPSERASSILHAKLERKPATITASKGNYLYTSDGDEIFDATCGAAVACIGHNDHRVKDAIVKQLDTVEYCYAPFFATEAAEQVATMLTDSTGGQMSKVFIVSSGTEAVEAALKLARQYFTELRPRPQLQRTKFIARRQSYHGNTLGSLSVGYHAGRRAIYEPILATNVAHVSPCYPYRDMKPGESNDEYVARLAQELDDTFQSLGPDTVCAFIAETVAGLTLGCVPPVPGYLQAMKDVCDRHGALFILDEVMSGMGRTGTLHAWSQESESVPSGSGVGLIPDLQTVAKGLGAGYAPIGALLVNKRVVDVLSHGTGAFTHSQTYQGHPVACAAANAVQQIIREENLLENVRVMGAKLGESLRERLGGHKNVGDIRGRGLLWGLEFVQSKSTKQPFPPSDQIAARIHNTGFKQRDFAISLLPGAGVVDGHNGDVIVLAPAYNITAADVEIIVDRLDMAVRAVLG
ncbi:hypothetical protein LTR99_005913 [Exophiala xenobiotica]|uniref:Aminotransferase n=1 Tax=Vermiconidia calcicola TaxID=1690605 RepID=A0AAV9QFZ5_9PEZI|nr:hypothetical protein LTR96_007793 [Exophiala xenobiotica]KAK5541013.1 hypothetical protein LTR25_002790 [Vermiconidia calcicola]KAK5549494.1 hypothetical protein LTR23_000602 [Chaetothyriales sp. CCFEE 6169]KAK5302956.1 hypothetical protein LTR99_005913 [Exophiala xenobiotica]KAK5340652.1 hypothetical protein LTR98_003774 [Exophiala xenobiotica]